jgi:hypothetical protein
LLATLEQLDYASSNFIDYVVEDCLASNATRIDPAFRTERLCVYPVKRRSGGSNPEQRAGGASSPASLLPIVDQGVSNLLHLSAE